MAKAGLTAQPVISTTKHGNKLSIIQMITTYPVYQVSQPGI